MKLPSCECLQGWLVNIGWGQYHNDLRPWQNRRRFTEDTFKCIFSSENGCILNLISLKSYTKGPVDNISILNQVIFCCRSGDQHDDVIKWEHFPRYWSFVQGIRRPLVNSPHESQWRGALMSSLICSWINGWVIDGEDGNLRRHDAHYDITVIPFLDPMVAQFTDAYMYILASKS